jgi:hypothetical protein
MDRLIGPDAFDLVQPAGSSLWWRMDVVADGFEAGVSEATSCGAPPGASDGLQGSADRPDGRNA